MSEIARLEKKVDEIRRMVSDMKKPFWVKAQVITSVTGWNYKKMEQARENGYVEFKKKDNGYWYNLNSINAVFLKQVS